jgi:hypothetical protein
MPAAKKPSPKKPAPRFTPKPAAKPAKKSRQPERNAAFQSLRSVLQEFAERFTVTADTSERYSLSTRGHVWRGGPMFFAEVRAGKVYVSYHLMPLYVDTTLQAVSPELARRKQGKTCFNFKKDVPPEILAELRDLTQRGIACYTEQYPGWEG